jgi:hypothetical protein
MASQFATITSGCRRRYFASVMPMLKQILVLASGKEDRMLRGKAMECISLIGIAVRYRLTTARVSRARRAAHAIAHRRVVCLSA